MNIFVVSLSCPTSCINFYDLMSYLLELTPFRIGNANDAFQYPFIPDPPTPILPIPFTPTLPLPSPLP